MYTVEIISQSTSYVVNVMFGGVAGTGGLYRSLATARKEAKRLAELYQAEIIER